MDADTIHDGNGGNDTLSGGDGNDQITVTSGIDTANGDAGDDVLIVDWSTLPVNAQFTIVPTLNGTLGGYDGQFYGNGSHYVTFTSIERFHISTYLGNDSIITGAGDDIISAGDGGDDVNVGSGNDTADGGLGTDRISADLSAQSGAILWNLRTNSYTGAVGNFSNFEFFGTVTTGSGNDVIVGGLGTFNETINSGLGDESVTVGVGIDTVNMGEGDDTLVIDWANLPVNASFSIPLYVNGTLGGYDGQFYGNGNHYVTFTSVENFDIRTSVGNNSIVTAGGADRVDAGDGGDGVNTGDGADIIISGAGNDSYNGGNGRDTLDFSGAAAAVNVDLAIGTAHDGDGGTDTLTSIEILIGSNFGDALTGGQASEVFYGGGSGDTMAGGNGGDFYADEDGSDTVTEAAGGGIDTVRVNASSYTLGANVENLIANAVNFIGTGNALNNTIIGFTGSDILDGGAGNDLVMGGGYIDTVIGGDGDDIVLGGQLGANLLVNGSFEEQAAGVDARTWIMAAPSGDYSGVPFRHESTLLNGWSVSGGIVEYNTYGSNANFATSDGDAALDMTYLPNSNLTIYQDIAGIVDAEPLVLSFDAALPTGGASGANPDAVLEVYWNGTLVGTVTPTTNEMTRYTFVLEGVTNGSGLGGANRLEFREVGNGADARGTILDNVQLNRMEHDGWDDSLLGGDGADMLFGGANSDTLNGGLGADIMRGALGDDTYYIDDAGDTIIEYDGEGNDLVSTSLNTFALGAHLEYLNFTGSGGFTGTGNALNNIINGAAGRTASMVMRAMMC